MGKVYDVHPSEVVEKAAVELKKLKAVKMPEWARVVKTGPGQERQPSNPDWWYLRAASVLRKVYTRGPIGVSKLRNFYGKKKNRGVKPERFYKSSGKIIRTILQQLETAELLRQGESGVHKGRVVTPKGQALLDNLVKQNESGGNKKAKASAVTASGDGEKPSTANETAGASGTA